MKRTVSLLTVLFCFVIWVQCVCAEPIISAETNQSTVTAGGVFTVSVKVNAENITGMQFDILYNPQTFEYQDSELTGVFDEALVSGIEAHEDGRVTLVAAFTEEQSISEKICAVDFRAIAGDGNLQIANIKLMVNKEKVSESDFDIAIKIKGRPSGGSISGGMKSSTDQSAQDEEQQIEQGMDEDQNGEENKDIPMRQAFDDINGHWAYDAIMFMLQEGIISGVGENQFAPEQKIKRSEFACMIANTLNLTEKAENQYADVKNDAWYADGVLKCTLEQLMLGADQHFRPDDLVTREEAAAVILRAAKYLELTLPRKEMSVEFSDHNEISQWAYESVEEMVHAGFISGFEDGTVKPKTETTRAQAAVLLCKLLQLQWADTGAV